VAVGAYVLRPDGTGDGGSPGSAGKPPATVLMPASSTGPTGGAAAGPTASQRARPTPTASVLPSDPPGTVGTTGPPTPAGTAAATRTVPPMYGWRESEMKAEMQRLGLIPQVTYRSTPDRCYVIEQSPAGGTVVRYGATVDVVVATATGVCKAV